MTARKAERVDQNRSAITIFDKSLKAEHPHSPGMRADLKALLAELEGAKERGTPSAPPGSAAPAKDGAAARGLFARLFGR